MGQEGLSKLVISESSVSILIVSSDEQIDFLAGWEHIDSIKTASK